MADSVVTWDLIARDKASRTVGHVGDSVESLTKRVTRLAGAFGGAFALQQAGEYALKMADQFELSRSRVENITKNLGSNFTAISGQVSALDDRLAAFGFANADVEGSLASLESVTKTIPKAFADVSLAANIARGRGIALSEATSILMRVETGHVAMLSRLGIATKDANGHLLTQQEALTKLTQLYGGAASRYSQTFAGKQAALTAELGNTAAKIGVALLPAAVDLARVLQKDVLPPLEHAAEFFDRNRKTIEPLIGALVKLALAYKGLKIAQAGAAAIRGIGAAAAPAEATLLGGISAAHPLPVYVVNGHGLPGAFGVGSKAAPALEGSAATATEGAGVAIGAQMAANLGKTATVLSKALTFAKFAPAAGVGAISDTRNITPSATFSAAYNRDLPIIRSLPKPDQAAALKALNEAAFGSGGQTNTVRLAQLEAAWAKLVPAVNKAATAESRAGHSAATANDALRSQSKALGDAQTKALTLSGGQDALRAAIHNMAVTAGTSGRALGGNSDAALANRDALRGAVQAGEQFIQTLKDQHVASGQVKAAELAVAQAILKNAQATYGNRDAVVAMLKELHFLPSQVASSLKDTYAVGYNAMVSVAQGFVDAGYQARTAVALESASLNKQLRLGLGADHAGTQATFIAPPPVHLQYKQVGGSLGGDLVQGYTPVVNAGISNATKSAASQAAQVARARLRQDFQTIKQAFASERESLISSFTSLSTAATTDSLGASGPPKPFLAQLNADARQMDAFTHLYLRLAHAGLDQRLLDQFQQLGVAAIPTMRLWLAHPRQIKQANRDERRIAGDASLIAARDTQHTYGPMIHRDLQHLPRKLALELRRELSHLGIHVSVTEIDRRNGHRARHR